MYLSKSNASNMLNFHARLSDESALRDTVSFSGQRMCIRFQNTRSQAFPSLLESESHTSGPSSIVHHLRVGNNPNPPLTPFNALESLNLPRSSNSSASNHRIVFTGLARGTQDRCDTSSFLSTLRSQLYATHTRTIMKTVKKLKSVTKAMPSGLPGLLSSG